MASVHFLLALCTAGIVCAQRPSNQNCMQCPTSEPYMVAMITEDVTYTYRSVATSTCPPYENPEWTNPSMACDFDKTFKIPLNPAFSKIPIPLGEAHSEYNGYTYLKTDPKPVFGAIGVLMNGVEVYGLGSPCGTETADCPSDGAPTEYVDAVDTERHTFDVCGGHASPTNSYHIHSGIGINSTAQREACRLPVDVVGEHSQLIGWIFGGFGLYGRYSQDGKVPTDLDECSGHTHVMDCRSSNCSSEMIYHYHLPDQFPWIIGCFKGCPETSNNEQELDAINSNSAYGCPEGLAVDPSTGGAVVSVSSAASLALLTCAVLVMEL